MSAAPRDEPAWPMWVDGALAHAAPTRVDPDLLLGNALFETLACSGGRPERLAAHLDRLARAARSLGRPEPPRAELEAAARALAAELPAPRGAVRLTLVDGGRACLGTSRPIPAPPAEGVVLWAAPASVRRGDPLESIKHSSRADKLYRRERARAAGAWDALLSNTAGRPVETTVANLWAVLDGRLVTPPIHEGCLPGVMRAELLARGSLATEDRSLPVAVAPLAADDLARAEELLVTNSLVGALGVRRLDRAGQRRELPGNAGPVARAAARVLGDPWGPGDDGRP